MKAVSYAFALAVVLLARPSGAAPAAAQTAERAITQANNRFAFGLYEKLRGNEGNLFFSPYSISTALAMTYAGAAGETENQMGRVLGFAGAAKTTGLSSSAAVLPKEQIHRAFGRIISDLNNRGAKDGYELAVANALWGQKGYEFLKNFVELIKTNYDGKLAEVDFAADSEGTRKTINTWVEQKTNDKIKQLIKPGVLGPMTRLVLTNAIYFKGKWAGQFKPKMTRDEPFTLLGAEKVDVPMMRQDDERFGYAENEDCQILDMPYVDNELSMVVLLPKKVDGVKKLERQLTGENVAKWLAGLHKRQVKVFVPKFRMTSEFGLSGVLASMGMTDAFSPNKADFSAMTGNRDLFISAVVHKAYVDVNEEGTEAAAATGVAMKLTSIGPAMPVFRADHPFIFLIRDKVTGCILFIGRVMNPTAG